MDMTMTQTVIMRMGIGVVRGVRVGQMFNHADQIQVAMVDTALGANGIGQA